MIESLSLREIQKQNMIFIEKEEKSCKAEGGRRSEENEERDFLVQVSHDFLSERL